ncbi:MAG: aminoacyl-tRNA hydrolase [Saprospiraceae bacterium]|jgi:ribosome-associated protein|nr:aminoacyl-tRNA hydrolase [Saprospiraceae bacterium]
MEDISAILSECSYSTSRSSGPGGQNVNKTETKVELRLNILVSEVLSDQQKTILLHKLGSKLVDGSTILITSQETRSQLKNKNIANNKLIELIGQALVPDIPRIPTRPTKKSKEKRIETKKQSGMTKSMRGNLKNKISKSDIEE